MRLENIQKWAEEVSFGEPPPVQPPFDDYGDPVNDEPAIYKEESHRDFQKRELYEDLAEKSDPGSANLKNVCKQIMLLSRAGPDKGLPHPPQFLPAVAGTNHSYSSPNESITPDFQSHSTQAARVYQSSPLSSPSVAEPNSVDFVDIDQSRFTVANAQIDENERSHLPPPRAKKPYYSRFKEMIDPDEPITPLCYLTGRPKADTDIFRSNAVRKQSNPFSDNSAKLKGRL